MFRQIGIPVLSIIAILSLAGPLKGFHVDLNKGGHNTPINEGLNLKKGTGGGT